MLSGSDDGTLRVWKNSNLVAREKEGLRADAERHAEEEQQSKRRAKGGGVKFTCFNCFTSTKDQELANSQSAARRRHEIY